MLALVIATSLVLSAPAQSWLAQASEKLSDISIKLKPLSETIGKVQEAKNKVDEMTTVPGAETAVRVRQEQPSVTRETLNATGDYPSVVTLV